MNTAFDLKYKVAKEAATLLYFGGAKEYKQAKEKAAQTLGTHFLPSNLEVALELDKIAEEKEGLHRIERLVHMRNEALKIMKLLEKFYPLLIGSVWRGTIREGSDIDITVYSDEPEKVINTIKSSNLRIISSSWSTINKQGLTLSSFHIYAETSTKNRLEIVVRAQEELNAKRKCEIFGDEIKGLRSRELEKLLKINPTKQFIPP